MILVHTEIIDLDSRKKNTKDVYKSSNEGPAICGHISVCTIAIIIHV